MKNIVVIYKSKYGCTKRYALWIKDALKCDMFDSDNIDEKDLLKYDLIIYGNPIYASKSIGKRFNKVNNIIIFYVGLSDVNDTDLNKLNDTYSSDVKKFFYFRGACDYDNLKINHKILIKLLFKMINKKSKDNISASEKIILETYNNKVDYTSKNQIIELINYVTKYY
ncbi:MAG: flavodoxin domain-containing protein [Bacilli bacterium]|jgi:menaquinone-dependent protoporphyrinogen IX oxidase|nr:flavodoxin domain-containing protein [Bacilli bacterium]